jgi:hypothetical protein
MYEPGADWIRCFSFPDTTLGGSPGLVRLSYSPAMSAINNGNRSFMGSRGYWDPEPESEESIGEFVHPVHSNTPDPYKRRRIDESPWPIQTDSLYHESEPEQEKAPYTYTGLRSQAMPIDRPYLGTSASHLQVALGSDDDPSMVGSGRASMHSGYLASGAAPTSVTRTYASEPEMPYVSGPEDAYRHRFDSGASKLSVSLGLNGDASMPGSASGIVRPRPTGQEWMQSRVSIVPYSVIGTKKDYTGDDVPPDSRDAFVDAAGLEYIQGNQPGYAGGVSAEIYKFLEMDSFPEDVVRAITKIGDAKLHEYPYKNSTQRCIHVVGPLFDSQPDSDYQIPFSKLVVAYSNVLREAALAQSPIRHLRLLPISGGIFAGAMGFGASRKEIHHITTAALTLAYTNLDNDTCDALCRNVSKVHLCIWDSDHLDRYQLAYNLRSLV